MPSVILVASVNSVNYTATVSGKYKDLLSFSSVAAVACKDATTFHRGFKVAFNLQRGIETWFCALRTVANPD